MDGGQFLGLVSALRELVGGARWHFRWEPIPGRAEMDGLRVEIPFASEGRREVGRALESRIPPPARIVAEPLRRAVDLDPVQTDDEMDVCVDLLWRWSDLLADLRVRNPGATQRQLQALTPGAFRTFVTGDRRHFEAAMDQAGFGSLPPVPWSRFASLLSPMNLWYRVPPGSREDAVFAARIHHLAACTFAGDFYPFTR
jgi:hypothetical protein